MWLIQLYWITRNNLNAITNVHQFSNHSFHYKYTQALKRVLLDDNRIEKIERRAFMNLRQLRQLRLRGNKLSEISDEGFQVCVLKHAKYIIKLITT